MSIVLRMYLNIQPLRASSSHIMHFWMFLKMLHCIRVYLNDNGRLPVNHSKSIQKLSVSMHKDKTRGKGHHWWTRFNCQLDVLCSLYQAEQHLWGWNMSAKTCSPNLATCMSVLFFLMYSILTDLLVKISKWNHLQPGICHWMLLRSYDL